MLALGPGVGKTASFAAAKLRTLGDLDKQARRRLKTQFGPSMPVLLDAAQEMIERGATAAARLYIEDEILDRDPTNAKGSFLRGQTFEQELQYTAAMQDYERALTHAGHDVALCAESALRILSLIRSDPRPREDMIPLLERAYAASADTRLALELAKSFEMLGKHEAAKEYYQRIFAAYSLSRQEVWEEAVVFLCQERRDREGDRAALDLIKEAQRTCPTSKVISRFEHKLMEDLGLLKYKTGRTLEPPVR